MSGVYIGVDGKARKVKGGYIGIDGKARKIKKGYIGDENGVARLCWTGADPVFANNSWEDIAAACQGGNVPATWAVGDQKTMSIDGAEYAVDIIGVNHDDYADGSGKAPLTFQLRDLYKTKYQINSNNTNIGGWTASFMKYTALPTIFGKLPAAVQLAIREVNKKTSSGNNSSTINTTAEKLFLLSEIEVFGSRTYSYSGEGSRYEYYKTGSRKIKKYNGTADFWWLRSPVKDSYTDFCIVTPDGVSTSGSTNYSEGVSFAFCF